MPHDAFIAYIPGSPLRIEGKQYKNQNWKLTLVHTETMEKRQITQSVNTDTVVRLFEDVIKHAREHWTGNNVIEQAQAMRKFIVHQKTRRNKR